MKTSRPLPLRAIGALALLALPALGHGQRLSARSTGMIELGVDTGNYVYREDIDGSFVQGNEGRMLGINFRVTEMLDPVRFVTAELRHANAAVYHTSASAGAQGSVANSVSEISFVAGRDFGTAWQSLSVYGGLGYRLLSDSATGFTTTGSPRYSSTREYHYLPIGLLYRHLLDRTARVALQFEYDYLLEGSTRSRLSNLASGLDDTVHTHRNGHGLRLGLAYEMQHWSLGVFYSRWRVEPSDPNPITADGVFVANRTEPHNITREVGLQLRYRFN